MSNYTDQRDAFGRQVQWLVEIDLDRCSLVYGVGSCTAVGTADGDYCWYSLPTCQVPSVYAREVKTYRFCLNDVPWPDSSVAVFPLIDEIDNVPQEIRADKLDTYPEKIKVKFYFDHNPPPQDHDKGVYNTSTAGEFWRNLVARNRNYVNRPLRVKRGFYASGFALADFVQVGPEFNVTAISIDGNRATLTAESPLAKLNKLKLPYDISEDNTLQASIDATVTSCTVLDADEFPNPSTFTRNYVYAKIENEIVRVTALDTATNVLTITRAQIGTTGASHAAGVKPDHVLHLGGQGASCAVGDAMLDLLEWAGFSGTTVVNTASFAELNDSFWPETNIYGYVTKSQEIAKHMRLLREPRGLVLYIDSDGKWAVTPMAPNQDATELNEDNLVYDSVRAYDDDEDRVTRCSFFYDPNEDNASDPKDFAKWVIVIDNDLEADEYFGDVRAFTQSDPWISPAADISEIRNVANRIITRLGGGRRSFTFELELRDADLGVGDTCTVLSRQVLNAAGNPDPRPCVVTARKESSNARFQYRAEDLGLHPFGRYLRIGPNTMADDYDDATDDDKAYGYWGDTDNRVGTLKELGYIFW